MPNPGIGRDAAVAFIHRVEEHLVAGLSPVGVPSQTGEMGAVYQAAEDFGLTRSSANARLRASEKLYRKVDWSLWSGGDIPKTAPPEPFEAEEIPEELVPVEELIERRKRQFDQKREHKEKKKLINVRVKLDGPIGIAHFGDPHVDDDGTDIAKIEDHINLVRETEGLFGANVGDIQNNWIARLARLWAEQSTSAQEAWQLTEWMVGAVQWLYLIGGNHDVWSGAGDPLKWMTRKQQGVHSDHAARLNLVFPNGAECRINARHDFHGHSQWNTAHGPAKAAQMGWRDHILVCGHKHIAGYNVLKDPATGLVSHALRVASYKTYDRYAEEKGLPDQNFSENMVTVIDPSKPETSASFVQVFFDIEAAADYLKYLRRDF